MIWSQRPDATACAELPLWNERLHRRVNRGSNGIGIVDNSSGQPRIKYLFDISDTSPRDPSVAPPYIWQMRPDAQDTVLDGISAALGEDMHTEFDFPINLYLSAQCFADKKASEYTDNTDLIRSAAALNRRSTSRIFPPETSLLTSLRLLDRLRRKRLKRHYARLNSL